MADILLGEILHRKSGGDINEDNPLAMKQVGSIDAVSIEETATETEQNISFDISIISFISNDGDADITFNFDNNTEITLRPGEILSNIPLSVNTLYYEAKSGEQNFRALGVE